jgi:hypothetical protein
MASGSGWSPPVTRGQPVAPPQPSGRTFALNPATTVTPMTNRRGFTMDQRRNDGSRMVLSQRMLPSGVPDVTGYRLSQDARAGTTTRVYSNGYRIVDGRDFRSRAPMGGPVYVNYSNGLRGASLPSGRPLYRETFFSDRSLGPQQFVRRTVYGSYYAGRPYFRREPVTRVYEVVPVYGVRTYVYRPQVYRPPYYRMFWVPLAAPIVVREDCTICPSRLVSYEEPITSYEDPVMLLGDLQISEAVAEGSYYVSRTGEEDREVVAVRSELSQLSRQLDTGARSNPELGTELASQKVQPKAIEQQLGAQGMQQVVSEQTPLKVPEGVRVQIRKQVRLAMAQQQNGKAVLLPDILASGYAPIYLFQAAEPLAVRNIHTGEECTLNPGDLTAFAQVPTANVVKAQMNVVVSRPGSCAEKTVVEVSPDELQDMLNGFSQRVETNMQRVSECSNPSARCTRL